MDLDPVVELRGRAGFDDAELQTLGARWAGSGGGGFVIGDIDMRFAYVLGPDLAYLRADMAQLMTGGGDFGSGMAGTTSGPPASLPRLTRLTPWDHALRFDSDFVDGSLSFTAHPVVRWTDRWGTRWEHRDGDVRKIEQDAAWNP